MPYRNLKNRFGISKVNINIENNRWLPRPYLLQRWSTLHRPWAKPLFESRYRIVVSVYRCWWRLGNRQNFLVFPNRFRLIQSSFSFKTKRNGYDTHGKDAHFFCNFCNYWSCSCSGTTTHSSGNEDHFGILSQNGFYFFHTFYGRFFSDIRIGTGASVLR